VSLVQSCDGSIGNTTRSPFVPLNKILVMIERQNDRDHVAWDLETTGFAWSDQITVSGFWFPGGHTELIINTGDRDLETEHVQTQLEKVSGVSVAVTVANDEAALLEAMQQILFDRFDRQYNRLVAFNAESWKSGFDLPFLRMRCLVHDHSWVFDNIQFADLWEPIKKRLNTTTTAYDASTDINSLTGSHAMIFDEHTTTALDDTPEYPPYRDQPYDPFTDSSSAVYSYQHGEYLPILKHNLADIHRTWELGEIVRQFVPGKDITTKKL
jgi:hypothetical protein